MTTEQTQGLTATEARQRIEQIWKDVLGIDDAEAGATFFEAGGQSVSAVRIMARIEEELGVMVDMGELFEDPDMSTFVGDVLAKLARV